MEGVQETGHNRTINRRKWKKAELEDLLSDEKSNSGRIFEWYARVLRRRSSCPAFHPDASQEVLDFGSEIFAFERKSTDASQTILCLFNFSSTESEIKQRDVLFILFSQC